MCSHVCSTRHITPNETHIAIDGVTTDDYSQSKCRAVEPIPNGYVYKTFPHLRCREHCKRRGRKTVWVTGKGVCCGTVSPRSVRSYIHAVSPTCLLKREFNKVAPMDIPNWTEKAHVTSNLYNRQPRITDKGRNSLQETALQLLS